MQGLRFASRAACLARAVFERPLELERLPPCAKPRDNCFVPPIADAPCVARTAGELAVVLSQATFCVRGCSHVDLAAGTDHVDVEDHREIFGPGKANPGVYEKSGTKCDKSIKIKKKIHEN